MQYGGIGGLNVRICRHAWDLHDWPDFSRAFERVRYPFGKPDRLVETVSLRQEVPSCSFVSASRPSMTTRLPSRTPTFVAIDTGFKGLGSKPSGAASL